MKTVALISFLALILFSGCNSALSNRAINKPTIKFTKEHLRNDPYLIDDNVYIESEKYFLSRRIELRNRIFDSLNVLTKNDKIIIVDHFLDSNGRQIEANYFYFGHKILEVTYEYEKPQKHYIAEIPIEVLKTETNHIFKILKHFDKNSLEEIRGNIDFGAFVFYNVTVSVNKNIGYYEITTSRAGNQIKRLK